jgi:hypothetical protein
MNTDDKQTLIVLCCGVFKAEILALKERHWPNLTIRFLSSMLHMRPDKLASRLDIQLKEEIVHGNKALLIYGDCCTQMTDFTQRPGVFRIRGNNCCDLLLGSEMYRQLSHEGAFFLFPEWAKRWRHIFSVELGLDEANAASLMGEMHRKLVYLDTGVLPVPTNDLNECSRYCGLPWEVLTVSLEQLRTDMQKALDKLIT